MEGELQSPEPDNAEEEMTEEFDATQDDEPTEGPEIAAELEIKDIESHEVQINNIGRQSIEHHDTQQAFLFGNEQIHGSLESFFQATLTASFFDRLTVEQIRQDSNDYLFNPEETRRLTTRFQKERMLWVEGPAGIGKTCLVLMASLPLLLRFDLRTVMISQDAPHPHLKVDLADLMDGNPDFSNTLVILRDAFHLENESLCRFAWRAKERRLKVLQDCLEKQGSFLALTWDDDRRPHLNAELESRIHRAHGPGRRQLTDYFQARAREVITTHFDDEEETALLGKWEETLGEQGAKIVEELEVFAKVERFLRAHLVKVLQAKDATKALRQALDHVDRLDSWLLLEVGQDPEALACTLALAVAHAGPTGFPARWYVFNQLRREFLCILRRELKSEGPYPTESLCREPELLREMDAKVVQEEGLGAVVSFNEDRRAELLWQSLLGAGRSIVSLLVPCLVELCEGDDFTLRQHAAWALARIGRLDAEGIPVRLIGKWLVMENGQDWNAALGALLQGVALQGNEGLKRLCLNRVKRELRIRGAGRAKRTAVLACGDVGCFDLPWVMQAIRRVAMQDLEPRLQNLQEEDRRRRMCEVAVRRITGSHDLQSAVTRSFDKRLNEILADLFPPGDWFALLSAFQYALVSLLFSHGAIPVFRELAKWMPDGEEAEQLAPWLALVFFRVAGVLDVVEKYPIPRSSSNEGLGNRILVAAMQSEEGAQDLALTWFKLFLGTRWFPTDLGHGLFYRLKQWLLRTVRNESQTSLRPFVIDLWRNLAQAPHMEFRHSIQDLLEILGQEQKRSVVELAEEIRQIVGD